VVTADDLYNRLQLSPAEMEAVDAAMRVARGVRGSGNSELLCRLSNPAAMIRRDMREKVQSRILTSVNRPVMRSGQHFRTRDRIPALDLTFQMMVKGVIGIEVAGLESVETKLDFAASAMSVTSTGSICCRNVGRDLIK